MIYPGVKSLKIIVVEFLRFVSLTSNQNAKKEARDFIKDVYQFIDQCGGVSDEQRKVFTNTVALGENMKKLENLSKRKIHGSHGMR